MAQRRNDARAKEPTGILAGERRQHFVEELGLMWEQLGYPRMQGRVLGYLMLSNADHVSSAELAEALNASAGSISTATRVLTESSLIRRVAVPGARGHFFRADDDVWGAFLLNERRYLRREQVYAQNVLAELGPQDEGPRRRMQNLHDYMNLVIELHRRSLEEWEAFKRRRDAGEA